MDSICAPRVQRPLPLPPGGVASLTVPAPALRSVPAAWVSDPPVALPPVFVATAILPPDPTVISRSAAAPVPPAAAFTLIATAPAVALVVVMAPPGSMGRLSAPAIGGAPCREGV